MSIVLIGYRGSGKSTVGRKLAERLSKKFFDSDELIVRRAGKSIKEIFAQDGEEKFRDLETTVVGELSLMPDIVIALGGGAVLRPANRAAIKAGGHKVVYLRCDAKTLHARIHADPLTAANRPALTSLGGGIEEIEKLLTAREPAYREVMTTEIDVAKLSADQVVDAILKTP